VSLFHNTFLGETSVTFLPIETVLGLVFDVGDEGHSLNKIVI
jgi:hypothetical protein